MGKVGDAFEKLVHTVHQLRDPQRGCPWDRQQTHESLIKFLIEEAYETVETIETGSPKFSEELGDVLLQVLLHSEIASETGRFDVTSVVDSLAQKLVARHPHVFGDAKVKDADEVRTQWEQQKKKQLKEGASIIDGVPRAMPALLRAQLIGQKSAKVGFEWPTIEGVRDKVSEELREFLNEACAKSQDRERLEEEFGDILFSLTQLARRLEFDSEEMLHKAVNKYARRFKEVERRAGPDIAKLGLEKLDALWEQVKAEEKGKAKAISCPR
jgi:tetrapyrrole methylase family protein / MazG family protein